MVSDDGSDASDGCLSDSSADWDMTGFIFGNIDNRGRVTADPGQPSRLPLDIGRRALTRVRNLRALGLQEQMDELSEGLAATADNHVTSAKDEDAVDFADITELATDATPELDVTNNQHISSISDSSISVSATTNAALLMSSAKAEIITDKSVTQHTPPDMKMHRDVANGGSSTGTKFHLNTPLGAMLPEKYTNVPITDLFPGFSQNKVLRFSKLFEMCKKRPQPPVCQSSDESHHHGNQAGMLGDVSSAKRVRSISQADTQTVHLGATAHGLGADPLTCGSRTGATEQEDEVDWYKFAASDEEDKIATIDTRTPDTIVSGSNKCQSVTQKQQTTLSASDDHGRRQSGGTDQSASGAAHQTTSGLCNMLYARNNQSTGEHRTMEDCRSRGGGHPRLSDWRHGPSQLWYDMLEWPHSGEVCDYGFRLKTKESDDDEGCSKDGQQKQINVGDATKCPHDDEKFLMVSQINWEDDVIWDGDDIRQKVLQKLSSKNNVAGWLPSGFNRTATHISHKMNAPPMNSLTKSNHVQNGGSYSEEWSSMFPVENEDLVYGRWEDDVILDSNAMDVIPKPRILTLDPNDENIILGIPEDIEPCALDNQEPGEQRKIKIPHPHVRKSKILLSKAGVITHLDEDSDPASPEPTDKDVYNVSNDQYYMSKSSDHTIKIGTASGLLQHATPVVELVPPFVPTHLGCNRLRQFHRTPLRRYTTGPMSNNQPKPVHSLVKHMRKKNKQREYERRMSGGGEVFFMRTPEDLSGKDGDLFLVEYCEEHPPIISMVGMCSKVRTYYRRPQAPATQLPSSGGGGGGGDSGGLFGAQPPGADYKYGELTVAHTSPFLGVMQPGSCLQTIENNMYRSPIYEHVVPPTDFVVIRNRQGYWIRRADALVTAAQQCALYEVPGPNSKRANNFTRDFLQVFIYRLFWKSNDIPRRIKMEAIRRAFPHHSESSIRKRLKPCADFKRTGSDSNWWVIKLDFRLPTEDEIRAMVSPEQCCAHYSMCAAEQRLKDAGYAERFLLTQGDDDDLDIKIDDEIKTAPWNTTRAYIQAVKGKCLLQLTGMGDPTSCGEGFSYIRVPNKPMLNKEEQVNQPKRIVTGTDADLRRLPLANAKALLKNFGVPDEEIKKLSRWEVIDVVRTLSTEKAKAGEEGMDRFSRGNRFSIAEHQERYKEECQRLFDLQNRILASDEILSTDNETSTEEEDNADDIEEHARNIENILSNKKTSMQLQREREEREREELCKIMMGDGGGRGADVCDAKELKCSHVSALDLKKEKRKQSSEDSMEFSCEGLILKITRKFSNSEGGNYVRVETVRNTEVIETYLRIRNTKDEQFIKQFAGQLDDVQKEEMKREKRRIQEQLRRIKRNQEKERLGIVHPPRSRKPRLRPDLKLKCGACGQVGHMRTNKACPLYQNFMSSGSLAYGSSNSANDDESMSVHLDESDDEKLINIDGTKIKLSGKIFKQAEEIKRKSEQQSSRQSSTSSSQPPSRRQRRQAVVTVGGANDDYLTQRHKTTNRRRIDPLITFSTLLESILNEMRDLPDVQPFLFPVNAKTVPDYYKIIQHPMDLQTIRDNLRKKQYQSREQFLQDVNQIVENSSLYNGAKSVLTLTARNMRNHLIDIFTQREERLMKLEKAINPLLDDNDQVGLSYILERILTDRIKTMHESWPFLKPVNRKAVKDYYEIVKFPVDIETIEKNIKGHKYHTSGAFAAEFELLLHNCIRYNGSESLYTKKAQCLVDTVRTTLDKYAEELKVLEANIAAVQQQVLENASCESESLGTAMLDESSQISASEAITAEDTSRLDASPSASLQPSSSGHRYVFASPTNEDDELRFSEEDDFKPVDQELIVVKTENEQHSGSAYNQGRALTACSEEIIDSSMDEGLVKIERDEQEEAGLSGTTLNLGEVMVDDFCPPDSHRDELLAPVDDTRSSPQLKRVSDEALDEISDETASANDDMMDVSDEADDILDTVTPPAADHQGQLGEAVHTVKVEQEEEWLLSNDDGLTDRLDGDLNDVSDDDEDDEVGETTLGGVSGDDCRTSIAMETISVEEEDGEDDIEGGSSPRILKKLNVESAGLLPNQSSAIQHDLLLSESESDDNTENTELGTVRMSGENVSAIVDNTPRLDDVERFSSSVSSSPASLDDDRSLVF